MRNVPIKVFPIAKTQVDREQVRKWLDFIGVSPEFDIPEDDNVADPALLVALAAKRCYKSFETGLNPNVTKVRKDWGDYLENVLKQGHGSVFEHAVYTFAIENCSRVFTGEMNRHRAGVGISEGSMRYIRYEDMPWWRPTSIQLTNEEADAIDMVKAACGLDFDNEKAECVFVHCESPAFMALDERTRENWKIGMKKLKTVAVFRNHFSVTEDNYRLLQEIWKDELAPTSKFKGKKQVTSMMRRIIPMGIATGGVWTMNIRAVRHIITMRASDAAEEEIFYIFSHIAKIMCEEQPMLLGDFEQTPEGFWIPKYKKV